MYVKISGIMFNSFTDEEKTGDKRCGPREEC